MSTEIPNLEAYRGKSDITTREIAELAGCSHSTVSRVFRNVSVTETDAVKRVRLLLEVTGYRPNPMVRSLMQSQGARRSKKEVTANIGWLNCHRNPKFWTGVYPWEHALYRGAQNRSEQLGYGFEPIWAREPGMTASRLADIIHARGVRGLVLANAAKVLEEIDFDYSAFPVVALGDFLAGQKHWDRVRLSGRQSVDLAFRELHALGYRRIALAVGMRLGPTRKEYLDQFNGGQYVRAAGGLLDSKQGELSGYCFARQLVDPKDQLEPFFYDRNNDDAFVEQIICGLERLQPDAVICWDRAVMDAIGELGLSCPKDIGIAHLGLSEDVSGWTGIDTNREQQAASAVDLLAGLIASNERGIPAHPKLVYHDGRWIEGRTTRKIEGS